MDIYDKRIRIEEVNRGYIVTVDYTECSGELTISRTRKIVFEDLEQAVSQIKAEMQYK